MKKIIALILIALVLTIPLTGCSRNDSDKGSDAEHFMYDNSEKLASITKDIEVIKDSLVYYRDTKVVYIMITLDSDYDDEVASYFAPYISENGKYCRYIDGKIVEIE